MFGGFNRRPGDTPEEANWEGWTPPWLSREGEGPRGPFGPGRGFGGPRGWRGPRGPFGRGFGGPEVSLARGLAGVITAPSAEVLVQDSTGAYPMSF